MLTKIDICSMALLKLGESPIQSLSDDSAAAKLARTLFDTVIDELIVLHPWHFATQQLELNKNTDGDFFIPSNVLRVLKTNGHIIGKKILRDSESVFITAITRVTPDTFPSYFTAMAATRLAMEFCIPLTGDQNIFRMLTALYETQLQTAKFIDSTITTCTPISDFSLLNARF